MEGGDRGGWWMDELRVDEEVDGWMDGWMDGWIGGLVAESEA